MILLQNGLDVALVGVCLCVSGVVPQVKSHGPGFTRLHAPWHVLSREAEFLKIKVPTKKVGGGDDGGGGGLKCLLKKDRLAIGSTVNICTVHCMLQAMCLNALTERLLVGLTFSIFF